MESNVGNSGEGGRVWDSLRRVSIVLPTSFSSTTGNLGGDETTDSEGALGSLEDTSDAGCGRLNMSAKTAEAPIRIHLLT